MSGSLFSVLCENKTRILFEMADDDRHRVEEPLALIRDVVGEGRQCGSSNINLALKNSECVILNQKTRERDTYTDTHIERERERERERD